MAEKTKEQELAETYGPIIMDLRTRRMNTEETWLRGHACWRGKTTRAFFKSEIFQHFLPHARRALEKFVKRAAQMLVPSSEFFEVYPAAESDEGGPISPDEQADAVRAYLSYLWNKRIKVYPFVRVLLRHYGLYGRCVAKSGVEVVSIPFYIRGKRGEAEIVTRKQVWPTARPVDPFMFYSYPETEADVQKCTILVEENLMPYEVYKKYADDPETGVKSIKQEDLTAPEWPTSSTRRLQLGFLVDPTSVSAPKEDDKGNKPACVDFVHISELWYASEGVWKMLWLCWNLKDAQDSHPIVVRSAPARARHPYRVAVDRQITGEQYTSGMMEDLEPLNVLLNDQLNMTLEGQATQFAPPAVIDPDLISRPASIVFRPRAKWFAKPEGVKWLEPPTSVTREGYMGLQFTMGLMDQYSGGGALTEGQPQRNMPRAGFAVSSLMNLSMTDTRDAAQLIEDLVLTPLLGDLFALTMEFVPDSQIVRIPGANGVTAMRVQVADMIGDYDFKWVGSLQAQDFQVRSQRLVSILGMIAKLAPAMTQQLQAEGKMMDWEYLFRRVWREALGERGAGSFIRRMTPQELAFVQQMMALQAAMAQKPPVKIALKGDLDPETAKNLSGDPTPVDLETLHQAGQRSQTAGAGQGGADKAAPGSEGAAEAQTARGMTP